MTSKFTENQREKAIEFIFDYEMDDDCELDIISIKEFMTSFKPWQIVKMAKQSGLNLDCNYIRVNNCYSDTHEGNEMSDLITDDEIAEALEQLKYL